MARAYTGNYDIIALRNSYHGGSQSRWADLAPHVEIQCAGRASGASTR